MQPNVNILSKRYATPEINAIFSERGTILAERELWIAVMKAQHEIDHNAVPADAIAKYEAAKEDIDADAIEKRELELRHDVKARIEAFVASAGAPEVLHRGMTSRDLTDNVEQMQVRNASKIIRGKYVAVLNNLLNRADQYKDVPLTARTHHQAAQPTTLGRRLAMYAEELAHHIEDFNHFIDNYPLRGIKGPTGTQYDMLSILKSQEAVDRLEKRIAQILGFEKTMQAPGQVYFRSLDEAVLSRLSCLSNPCANFGIGMRLMAGYDLVTEGFKEGQVGSSAMPHKMNTRTSERIVGLSKMIKGYQDMASRVAGDTWEEGDVSCSVVRRVDLSDAFYCSDGLCESTLTVLKEMGAYPGVLKAEVQKYLPFMGSTGLMRTLQRGGIGREKAHELVKKHSVAQALEMRKGNVPAVLEQLANDPLVIGAGVTLEQLNAGIDNVFMLTGNAAKQVDAVREAARPLLEKYAAEAAYKPRDIR